MHPNQHCASLFGTLFIRIRTTNHSNKQIHYPFTVFRLYMKKKRGSVPQIIHTLVHIKSITTFIHKKTEWSTSLRCRCPENDTYIASVHICMCRRQQHTQTRRQRNQTIGMGHKTNTCSVHDEFGDVSGLWFGTPLSLWWEGSRPEGR